MWRAKVAAEALRTGGEPDAIVTQSGRGDEDADTASRWFGYVTREAAGDRPQCRILLRAVLDENEEK